jgi:hypothetical protein
MVMAWIKEIEEENTSAVARYWQVISILYNHRSQKSVLEVGGWVSKDAYDNQKTPLMTRHWEIGSGLAPELAAGALAFVEGYALSQLEFQGAEIEGG